MEGICTVLLEYWTQPFMVVWVTTAITLGEIRLQGTLLLLFSRVWFFVTHGLQHTRLLCPSPSPGVSSNSNPLSQWCHLTISCSVIPFPSCLQSFLASGSFSMSQFFVSGSRSIRASASVLPMNIQGWFSLGLTGFISLLSKGLSGILSSTYNLKASIFWPSAFIMVQLYMTTGQTITLTIWTFVGKVISLLFNTLSRLVINFLPRSKRLLVSWLQSPLQWFWSPWIQSLPQFPLFPLLFAMKWWHYANRKWKWKSLSHVWLFVTPWTIQSLEFSRPDYWSG